jgi:hypothetical protein
MRESSKLNLKRARADARIRMPQTAAPEVEAWIEQTIKDRFAEHNTITYSESLDFLECQHRLVMPADTLQHRMRSLNSVKTVIAIPMEVKRVAVERSAMERWHTDLAPRTDGIPRRFRFNVDEAACAEFVDSREVKVLVPVEYHSNIVPIPVDWLSK